MRKWKCVATIGVVGLIANIGTAAADDPRDAGGPSLSQVCDGNRALRVKVAQDDTREWLARIGRVRAACSLTSTPTGATIHDGNRSYPEMKSGVVCPKGVPAGETKESAWGILSILQLGGGSTEKITEMHDSEDEAAGYCEADDRKVGLVLRVYVSDLDGLRQILAWKPAKKGDGGV